jgi:hypothetical protein
VILTSIAFFEAAALDLMDQLAYGYYRHTGQRNAQPVQLESTHLSQGL